MRDIDACELARICGGMKWQNREMSVNVEDRRPGAPPLDVQRRQTEEYNRGIRAQQWGQTYKDSWRPNQGFGR
jgi:hypothetical protein